MIDTNKCACGAWHCDTIGVAYSFECVFCIERGMCFLLSEVGQ